MGTVAQYGLLFMLIQLSDLFGKRGLLYAFCFAGMGLSVYGMRIVSYKQYRGYGVAAPLNAIAGCDVLPTYRLVWFGTSITPLVSTWSMLWCMGIGICVASVVCAMVGVAHMISTALFVLGCAVLIELLAEMSLWFCVQRKWLWYTYEDQLRHILAKVERLEQWRVEDIVQQAKEQRLLLPGTIMP